MGARSGRLVSVVIILILINPAGLTGQRAAKLERAAMTKLDSWTNPVSEWHFPDRIRVDSLSLDEAAGSIDLWFPAAFSYNPVREENAALFENSIRDALGRKFRNYKINIRTNGFLIGDLIPNYYRNSLPADTARLWRTSADRPVLIRKVNGIFPSAGLAETNLAIWHSHGYYFDQPLDRWEWQRAKLFGTVEDISVMGYVLPYLTRMLENSGATVFVPRERDTQINEVIVDNDRSSRESEFVIHISGQQEPAGEGFLLADTIFTGDNPFRKGTSLRFKEGAADYIADFPEKGNYAVYVSYPQSPENSTTAKYTVRHSGGNTSFIVDQTIGGGTWIYLGTFHFNAGKSESAGAVTVTAGDNGYTAMDAVKFGGGMGNVARRPSGDLISNQWSLNSASPAETVQARNDTVSHTWKLSGKPRYVEGARYYLQYAGMPDTLVYTPNKNRNDYNDDYMSRGAWVNYLAGSADPGADKKETTGLGIPVDLALAFHTDAGVTPDDSIIGTLGIYSTAAGGGKFPNGTSRMASRDLTDMVQTQIVGDVKALFNPQWTRRGLWDRSYSEARTPAVPAMLLELLSHQNQGDQRYGLDPRFRFHVSRAVYKGILRYLSFTQAREYAVQPLPVTDLAVIPIEGRRIKISWAEVHDPLEPSAQPAGYRIYTRTGDNGFDNGFDVMETSAVVDLPNYDTVYSFRVTAFNDGGESFESETLAVGLKRGVEASVLIVNGFDRISGPEWFDRGGLAGVAWWRDRGVADRYDIVATGDQYDFERSLPWTDDDNSGWGASWSDMEGKIIPGNTFDFACIHGKAIMAAGYSFSSVSDEVFSRPDFDITPYKVADLIFGEEKTTAAVNDSSKFDFQIYTPEFTSKIKAITEAGISLFMSGSYVGTDLRNSADTSAMAFAADYLHFRPMSGHAVKNGILRPTDIVAPLFSGQVEFNTLQTGEVYGAEAPDAIVPADKSSVTAFRYTENNTSAGVIYRGKNRTLVMGFPFETVISESERNSLMDQILKFLLTK